jgi:hypothetical protein
MTFFDDIMNDVDSVEQELLGPDYSYWKHIKGLDELNITSDGDGIVNDFKGLMDYIKILITGRGGASDTGKPLGNAFFMKTGASCLDVDSNKKDADKKKDADNKHHIVDACGNKVVKETDEDKYNSVDRYVYINNIPDGDIPFLSSLAGEDFTFLEGLVPGIMSNMNNLNPFSIFSSFLDGVNPKCKKVSLKTANNKNVISYKEQYVTLTDIKSLNPCWFKDKKNPLTGKTCPKGEGFQNRYENNYKTDTLPSGIICKAYYTTLCLMLLYLFYKIASKKK